MLQLGKSLALDCTISGYPVEQIVFKHNQQVIKSISGSIPSSSTNSNYRGAVHQFQAGNFASSKANNNALASTSSLFQSSSTSASGSATNPRVRTNLNSAPSAGYFVVDEQQLAVSKSSFGDAGATATLDDDSADNIDSSQTSSLPEMDSQKSLNHVIVIVLEPQHTGAYQCFASNQFESAQSSAYIRVLDDPPKFKETFKSQVYDQHQDISLQCSARANPLPEITWSLDDAHLPESSRIRFGDFVTKVSNK